MRIVLAHKIVIFRIVLAHKCVIVRIVMANKRGDYEDSVGS
jgi:hypothetical protein